MCRVQNFYNLGSNFSILPDDHGRANKPIDGLTVPGMGQFKCIMSPMRLLRCPASFQKLVEMAMKGLISVIVYIDKILLHSRNHFEHREQFEKLFTRLRNTKHRIEK